MLKDLNFGEFYKDAEGNIYKLTCHAIGDDGVKVIYAKVDIEVGDLHYCGVQEFENNFKPVTRFV